VTDQEFNAWAYRRVQVFLEETVPSMVERPGFARLAGFVAGVERDRAVLVTPEK
jgi:hypothetical protein